MDDTEKRQVDIFVDAMEYAQKLSLDELKTFMKVLRDEVKHRQKQADHLAAMQFRKGDLVKATTDGRKLPIGSQGTVKGIRGGTVTVDFGDLDVWRMAATLIRKVEPEASDE